MNRISLNFCLKILAVFIISLFGGCNLNTTDSNSNKTPKKFQEVNLEEIGAGTLKDMMIVNSNNLQTIKLPKKLNETLNLSSLIDSVWYTKLETSETGLIGEITQLIPFEDKFFIFDKISKAVFIFSYQGKLINKIFKRGKGPGEYGGPTFIALDKKSKTILILDDKLSKVLYYDFHGKFIKEVFVKFRFSEFHVVNPNLIVAHTYKRFNDHLPSIKNYQLLTLDSNWHFIGRATKYDVENQRASNIRGTAFTEYNHKVSYLSPFKDTVYTITNEGLFASYGIDFGIRHLPKKFDYNIKIRDFLDKYRNSEFAYTTGPFYEMDNFITFNVNFKNRLLYIFYSKKKQELRFGNKIHNDIYSLGFNYPLATYDNDVIISSVSSYVLAPFRKELLETSQLREEVKSMIKNIKENDNPILTFHRIK